MAFTPENAPEFENRDDPGIGLKQVERMKGWVAEPWHFQLVEHIQAFSIHAFFGNAKMMDKTIYFDGRTKWGKVAYEFARQKYAQFIAHTLGDVRLALAEGGRVLKSEYVMPEKHRDGFLPKDEINLMMDLSKRAMAGQAVDSHAELAAHRAKRDGHTPKHTPPSHNFGYGEGG